MKKYSVLLETGLMRAFYFTHVMALSPEHAATQATINWLLDNINQSSLTEDPTDLGIDAFSDDSIDLNCHYARLIIEGHVEGILG